MKRAGLTSAVLSKEAAYSMSIIRRGSARVHEGDDGSGRIALIGLFVVLALIFAAVKLTAQETPAQAQDFAGSSR